jgi:pyrimidine-nucleoside phosphorylase
LNIVQLIETKKRGGAFQPEEIDWFVSQFATGHLPDYQMAAMLMAIWFQGMEPDEISALTGSMLRSGEQLAFDGLPAPTADKHSTGGVGDKVSLLLAPLAAACGLYVPMLSGRGLGHTGGTLDKLEAIPGYRIHMENEEFIQLTRDHGCAIVGQSGTIAPADGRIYALRDVTGTVDCVPLITASIMSKKLAAGPQTIVIDLKVGSGAFMTNPDDARLLAQSLVRVGEAHGRNMRVIFSDMSQPLGVAVGHANETIESLDALRPGGRSTAPQDLVVLTEELVADMLTVSGHVPDHEAALARVREVWDNGRAFAKTEEWIASQDGRIDPGREDYGLDLAPRLMALESPVDGYLADISCREFGFSLAEIGGARQKQDDVLDLSSGIDFMAAIGDKLEKGQPLAWIRAHDNEKAAAAAARLVTALKFSEEAPARPELIQGRV